MAEGDVYRYTPKSWHCHEGMAVEMGGVIRDTYWGMHDRDPFLTKVVKANDPSLDLIGNLSDYERLPVGQALEEYAESDRLVITSQAGHQRLSFRRIGSLPDLETKILNARAHLGEARRALRNAQYGVEWALKDLERLEAQRVAAE